MPAFASPSLSRREMLVALAAAAGAGLALPGCDVPRPATPPGAPRLRLLAEQRWSHALRIDGTPAGGLSGIDCDVARGEYLLLSDDRSDLAPVRFYTAAWAEPARSPPVPSGVVFLQRPAGGPWRDRRHAGPDEPVPDPESIRIRPGGNTLLWSSEGDVARGFGPALYESTRDGKFLREHALPTMFRTGPAPHRGPRENLSLEGLAITPDGHHAWLAMENALAEDGPEPTVDAAGGPCRFTQIDLETGAAVRQIAYVPDPIPLRPRVPGTFADNGVSEVLMIDAHRMLVLERAYAAGVGNSLRLYEIDTRAADDVRALEALRPGNHRATPKTLVADFGTLGLSRLDNSEGLCWGPPLPSGRPMLVVVSDDNFNPLQITQFAAFEFIDRP